MNAYAAFTRDRWLVVDPRGAQVVMSYRGRTLLGDVTGVTRWGGLYRLDVRYFNGEPWPTCPLLWECDVLERTYESEEP